MKRSAPLLLAITIPLALGYLPAQPQTTKNVELPVLNPAPSTSPLPFREDKIHYQQWYEGAQFGTKIKQPVRIIAIEFDGALPAGTTLDVEVTMANASASLSGLFANNLVSNAVTVVPRRQLSFTGTKTRIDFVNHWKYDGMSNAVVDIKIFGNSAGNPVNFVARSTVLSFSNTKRQYFIGNPNAPVANSPGVTGHYGLMTKFYYQEGGTYDYGSGCPGGLNTIPLCTANRVPLPGDQGYTQILTSAGSGYPAAFVLGISRTTWGGAPLPLPLSFLGASNCNLQASGEVLLFTTTVGGGPGQGSAQMPTPIPAIGALAGAIVYSQWIVFDAAAPNGVLSTTAGLMHVVGS